MRTKSQNTLLAPEIQTETSGGYLRFEAEDRILVSAEDEVDLRVGSLVDIEPDALKSLAEQFGLAAITERPQEGHYFVDDVTFLVRIYPFVDGA